MFLGTPLLGNDRRFSDWAAYMTMPALFFLVTASITNLREMKIVVLLMCAAVLLLDRSYWNSVRYRDYSSYSDELHEEGSAMGYAGSNGLAAFEAQFSIFLLAMAAVERKRLRKYGYLGLAAFGAVCLTYALSRAGYLAFLAGWVFLGVVKQRKLLIALAVFAAVWTAVVPGAVRERVEMTRKETGELDDSAATRVQLWEDAMQLYQSSPWFGLGLNTYAYLRRVRSYADTHNIYLKVLVETGAVGLLLFILLLIKNFRWCYRLFRLADDPFRRGLGLGLAGWVVAAAVANAFGDRWTFLKVQGLFWGIAGLVARGHILLSQEREVPATAEAPARRKEDPVPVAAGRPERAPT